MEAGRPRGAIFWTLLMLASTGPLQSETLVLAVVDGTFGAEASVEVLRQAYGRLGVDLEIRLLPGDVSLSYSNSGMIDGEVQRIDGLGQRFEGLVQVPVPVNYLQAVAFASSPDLPLAGWFGLRPYRIGIVRGVRFAEEGTQGLQVQAFDSYGQLMDALEAGTVEFVVMPRINGLVEGHRHGRAIYPARGVLETLLLYHYLHESRADLIPRIEAELKAMVLDGTTRRIRARIYAGLLDEEP